MKTDEAGKIGGPFSVKVYDSFDALPACYGDLFDHMAGVNFSTSRLWFETFQRTAMQEDAALRLYGVEAEGESGPEARGLLVAQTPAARRGAVLRDRYIGRHSLSGLTGYQTYLFAPLLRDDDPAFDGILDCLARHLRGERPKWEMIEFAAMDAKARSFAGLQRALSGAGYVVRSYPHFMGFFETTAAQDYAAYIAARPQSERKQIKNYERKERKLQNRDDFRCELFTSEEGLDQALKDYAKVLEASWKEPDVHPDFLPACIRAAAQAGALRLFILYLGDQPAATQLVFFAGRRAIFYRTAYDPAFARDSVGAIVKLRMVQHLLDEDGGLDEMDYGRDRESFKKIWASQEHTRCGLLAFDCTTLGGLRGLAEQQLFELRDKLGQVTRPLRERLQALQTQMKEKTGKSKDQKAG